MITLSALRASAPASALIGLLMLVSPSHAQNAPSDPANLQTPAQRIDNYYQRQTELKSREDDQDPVAGDQGADTQPLSDSDVRFMLSEVRFSASELLSAEELEEIASPFTGREVGMADLQQLLDAVNAAYAGRGISTARAMLSAQAIEGGVVRVELVEGRLGELRIVGEAHAPERFVRRRISQQPGELVDAQQLRDELVFLNRTTDVRARALMQAGKLPGETDVAIELDTPARTGFGVFVDNSGVESTGRERVGVQGQAWGLLGVSDLLAGSVAWARGGLEGRVGYSGIVNRRNGRFGLQLSRNQINIIDGAYDDLDITGESTSYGLDFRQPFIANQRWLLQGSLAVARVSSSTDISGERIAETDSDMATIAVLLGYRGEGREFSITQAVSQVRIDEPLRGDSRFTSAPGSLSWTQRLGQSGLLTRTHLGWQYASSDHVPSGNLFQIGGVGTVRGYERGILGGPRGYYANLELHRPYRDRHDVYVFLDYGKVEADFPEKTAITGMGVGFAGQWGRRFAYSLDVGHAFDTVIGDQDSVRADFRLTATWE